MKPFTSQKCAINQTAMRKYSTSTKEKVTEKKYAKMHRNWISGKSADAVCQITFNLLPINQRSKLELALERKKTLKLMFFLVYLAFVPMLHCFFHCSFHLNLFVNIHNSHSFNCQQRKSFGWQKAYKFKRISFGYALLSSIALFFSVFVLRFIYVIFFATSTKEQQLAFFIIQA